MSYDMIDRFLRNNLDDDNYAEYSAALDELCTPPAQRKPLTDEEARKLIKVGPVYAPDGVVTRSPIAYRKELEEAGLRGLRKGEAAHNIKENT